MEGSRSLSSEASSLAGVKATSSSDPGSEKMFNAFIECVCFYAHITSLIVFREFGHEKRQALNSAMGRFLVDATVELRYGEPPTPEWREAAQELRSALYGRLNSSEGEYARCKAWVVRESEDYALADKVAGGVTSKGTINLCADNLARVLEIHNPFTLMELAMLIARSAKVEEFKRLAIAAAESL